MKRLALSLAFNLSAMVFDILMVMVAAQRRVDWSVPLVDVGFTFIPEQPIDSILNGAPDFCVMSLLVITLIRCLFHPERKKCLRRLFIVGGIISIMRGLSITMTILPEPSPLCKDYYIPRHEIIFKALYHKLLAFLQGTSPLDCGGVFFSGHTATVATCAMVWTQFTNIKVAKILVWIWTLITGVVMIAVRFHYTLDVVYGFFIAITVWNYYHSCALNPNLLRYSVWKWLEGSDAPCPGGLTAAEELWERFLGVLPFSESPPRFLRVRNAVLRNEEEEEEGESKSLFKEEQGHSLKVIIDRPHPYSEV